jgi:nicotinamidase-related amidase
MEHAALIIVDMLNDFVDPTGALYCGESARRIIAFIQQRLAAYRSAGHTVIFLQDAHDPDDREFEKFPPHCLAGTWGSEVIPELQPARGEVVVPKKRFSGFFGTRLEEILTASGATSVEVVGVCTGICVMDTVGGLVNRGYPVVVPADGVADFDPEAHAFALARMAKIYGVDVR